MDKVLEDLHRKKEAYQGVGFVEIFDAARSNAATPLPDAFDLLAPLWIFPNINRLTIRFSARQSLTLDVPLPTPLLNLTHLSLRGCHISWLRTLARIPSLRELDLSLFGDQPLVEWTTEEVWSHLEVLKVEVPPSYGEDRPINRVFSGLVLPLNSSLRSLTIAVRLQLHHRPEPCDFQSLIPCLTPFKSLSKLSSLTIDEFATAVPSSIAVLAEDFPLLTELKFKDRTVWIGSKADHLSSLSHFPLLKSLECPRWPEDTSIPEAYTEPEILVREASRAMRKLELLGMTGKYSNEQWWRIGRDEEREVSQIDEVEFWRLDLMRCQDQSIFESLNKGMRAFDLRYAYLPDNSSLGFYHADALMSPNTTLEDVFFGFYKWLDQHPSETLFVSMQVASGINDARFQELTYQALNSPVALQYWVQTNATLGTLGEVRGKINLFARFDWADLPSQYDNRIGLHFSPSQWIDNGASFSFVYNEELESSVYVEDLYEFAEFGVVCVGTVADAEKLPYQPHRLWQLPGPSNQDRNKVQYDYLSHQLRSFSFSSRFALHQLHKRRGRHRREQSSRHRAW
ncbi:1-phosphatidylinositol phosphodiesterase, partial [Phenoliferia sp. Uapishka_3]